MNIDPNLPAYPVPSDGEHYSPTGLTIRAAMAKDIMSALAANPNIVYFVPLTPPVSQLPDQLANKAVKMADALIEALNK